MTPVDLVAWGLAIFVASVLVGASIVILLSVGKTILIFLRRR